MNYFRNFYIGLMFFLNTICYVNAAEVSPDPELSFHLSPAGPLSIETMQKIKTQKALKELYSIKSFANTYTYLRCFYPVFDHATTPDTAYIWAKDPSSGDFYRVSGSWWAGGPLSWQNMFYSSVSQETLKTVCESALNQAGIQKPLIMFAGANNALSFNYTIWTNDGVNQSTTLNKIVAFGDSLSDNQNIYNAMLWKLPNPKTWFLGRFSNGKNWVEYTAENIKLPLYNWSIGGTGIRLQNGVIPDLEWQINSWKAYMRKAENYRPENTLFTVFVGGNDLISDTATVDQLVATKTRALHKLIGEGAKNILLFTLPDVSRTPLFVFRNNKNSVKAKVLDLNNKLSILVENLKAHYGSTLSLYLFDTYSMYNDVLADPAKYNITNTTTSCLDINDDSALNYLKFSKPRMLCKNPENFVFWDMLHPTTRVHQIFADAVTRFAQEKFTNLPGH